MFGLKKKRRERIRNGPFPEAWANILEKHVAYYHLLTPEDQAELRGHIQVFLDEKAFEGCDGLEINDEIRVVIAAQACILLLHRETDYYPTLNSILVYPHQYFSPGIRKLSEGVVAEGLEGRLGESWYRGPVVLSWDDVRRTAHDHLDGHNVVFHEFAHQLDSESGANEGAPLLPRRSMYIAWARVLGNEYAHLISELDHHHNTDLDAYGATNPAEFFAVVTEAFFENPVQLKQRHPRLYEQLALFFRQDPATRFEEMGVTDSRREKK
ncbi:MAG: zinc-dependent peptidase [Deltaproteobacteria bacterium]|nr:zinc-dependent peptidase [Deltaproteobacteria bacterium]